MIADTATRSAWSRGTSHDYLYLILIESAQSGALALTQHQYQRIYSRLLFASTACLIVTPYLNALLDVTVMSPVY